jgi:hypothetical protein
VEFKKKVAEETLNLALHSMEEDTLREHSHKGLSDDDLGYPGPSDGR